MLLVYHLPGLYACFEHSQFQDVAGFFVQYEFMRAQRLRNILFTHLLLKLVFY